MPQSHRNDVFLSYARADRAVASEFARRLQEKGVSVWFDVESLRPGDYLLTSQLEAIRATNIFVFLVSEASTQSPHSASEFASALASQEIAGIPRIIPVRIDKKASFIPFLDRFAAVEATSSEGLIKAVDAVCKAAEDQKRGPIPSEAHLAKYENVVPGAAERILLMAERQQLGRLELEKAVREMRYSETIARVIGTGLLASIGINIAIFFPFRSGFAIDSDSLGSAAIGAAAFGLVQQATYFFIDFLARKKRGDIHE
ncbi:MULTISPECIES: DUF2335 domain-containing protein [Sphingomonas]|jgi:uncharacterized membrane protein|uniref:DUF2335 domain-containing protein n=1 Tax=Sphingomonas TaxID=13687 RepID=UPI001AE398EE